MSGEARAEPERRRLPRPLEGLLVSRHRKALSGRVLEVGSSAGRLEPYFIVLRAQVTRCPPDELEAVPAGAFDAAVATGSVFDPLSRLDRRAAQLELHRALVPGGLYIKSCPDHAARRRQRVVSPSLSQETQERRLAELGFDLLECVEVGGGAELLCVARRD